MKAPKPTFDFNQKVLIEIKTKHESSGITARNKVWGYITKMRLRAGTKSLRIEYLINRKPIQVYQHNDSAIKWVKEKQILEIEDEND